MSYLVKITVRLSYIETVTIDIPLCDCASCSESRLDERREEFNESQNGKYPSECGSFSDYGDNGYITRDVVIPITRDEVLFRPLLKEVKTKHLGEGTNFITDKKILSLYEGVCEYADTEDLDDVTTKLVSAEVVQSIFLDS